MEERLLEIIEERQKENDLAADSILNRIFRMESLAFDNYKLKKENNELREQITKLIIRNNPNHIDDVNSKRSIIPQELETQKFLKKFGLEELVRAYLILSF